MPHAPPKGGLGLVLPLGPRGARRESQNIRRTFLQSTYKLIPRYLQHHSSTICLTCQNVQQVVPPPPVLTRSTNVHSSHSGRSRPLPHVIKPPFGPTNHPQHIVSHGTRSRLHKLFACVTRTLSPSRLLSVASLALTSFGPIPSSILIILVLAINLMGTTPTQLFTTITEWSSQRLQPHLSYRRIAGLLCTALIKTTMLLFRCRRT